VFVKFTPVTADLVIREVRFGSTRERAAKLAGITPRSLRLWVKRSKSGVPLFAGFHAALEAAEAEYTRLETLRLAEAYNIQPSDEMRRAIEQFQETLTA
jgi:hypothetical protein